MRRYAFLRNIVLSVVKFIFITDKIPFLFFSSLFIIDFKILKDLFHTFFVEKLKLEHLARQKTTYPHGIVIVCAFWCEIPYELNKEVYSCTKMFHTDTVVPLIILSRQSVSIFIIFRIFRPEMIS